MQVHTSVGVRDMVCAKQRQCVDDISNKKCNICNLCETEHGREISIELKTGMKCVAARSIKSAIELVFAHVKDTGRLAYWNLRGQRCSSSPWHGYLPTMFDYRCVCVER